MNITSDDDAAILIKRGLQYYQFGEISAAEECLRRAIALDPQNAEAWLTLGHIYRDRERYTDAQQCYRRATEIHADWQEAWQHLGMVSSLLEQPKDSIHALLVYMELGGSDLHILEVLARTALDIDDCRTVIRVTKRILDLNEELAWAWRMRGICQAKLSRFNAACVSLNMAIDFDPSEIVASNSVGDLCYDAGNFLRCVDFYEISLESDPNQPRILFRYGTALWLVGRWMDAIPHLEKYVGLVPDDPRGWNNLGVVLRERGEVKRAIECYKRALELDPSLDVARRNLETASHKEVIT